LIAIFITFLPRDDCDELDGEDGLDGLEGLDGCGLDDPLFPSDDPGDEDGDGEHDGEVCELVAASLG
jgi:hypothetical protein